jgi:hypothetical protein
MIYLGVGIASFGTRVELDADVEEGGRGSALGVDDPGGMRAVRSHARGIMRTGSTPNFYFVIQST